LSQQPVPETRLAPEAGRFEGPLFGLAPDGVFRAPAITRRAVGSYPAFSPLPLNLHLNGGLFSVALSVERPFRTLLPRVSQSIRTRLRGIAPYGVRTFLPRLAPEAILRPSKIEARVMHEVEDDKKEGAKMPRFPSRIAARSDPACARCCFIIRPSDVGGLVQISVFPPSRRTAMVPLCIAEIIIVRFGRSSALASPHSPPFAFPIKRTLMRS